MFLGVCVAALLVIPGLCSAAIKPLMDKFYNNEKGALAKHLDIQSEAPDTAVKNLYNTMPAVSRPNFQTFSNRPQYGMKVGGV